MSNWCLKAPYLPTFLLPRRADCPLPPLVCIREKKSFSNFSSHHYFWIIWLGRNFMKSWWCDDSLSKWQENYFKKEKFKISSAFITFVKILTLFNTLEWTGIGIFTVEESWKCWDTSHYNLYSRIWIHNGNIYPRNLSYGLKFVF